MNLARMWDRTPVTQLPILCMVRCTILRLLPTAWLARAHFQMKSTPLYHNNEGGWWFSKYVGRRSAITAHCLQHIVYRVINVIQPVVTSGPVTLFKASHLSTDLPGRDHSLRSDKA